MRITVDIAMRVRDVSRTREAEAAPQPQPVPAKPRKGERRRLSKRGRA